MSFKYIIKKSYIFNFDLFKTVYGHSIKFTEEFLNNHHSDTNLNIGDNVYFWISSFSNYVEKANCVYLECYENLSNDKLHPVGYGCAYIIGREFHIPIFISGCRSNSVKPVILDKETWNTLFRFTIEHNCDKFIFDTHRDGRIWKALNLSKRLIDYPVEYKNSWPIAYMIVDLRNYNDNK